MQQELSAEKDAERDAIAAAKAEDDAIWERQNFMLGCDEMERITDDIVVPVFSALAKSIKAGGYPFDIILMDCESPLDQQLYNVGVRLSFSYEGAEIEINIVADPSDFSFSLNIEGGTETFFHEFKFHEIVPRTLQNKLSEQFEAQFPQVKYKPVVDSNDQSFEAYEGPFRVQYDDNGSVSDVATTKTLQEAASMGSTFAKMFKKENAITILDANDAVVC